MEKETAEELLARTRDFVSNHLNTYLTSGGKEGHIVDLTHAGARGMLPTLLLKTIGRRSGKSLIAPLIYGVYGGEWVIIASKGGAPEHPAWFLNLQGRKDVSFQVATQAFQGTWRVAEGQERTDVWNYMSHLYPPYPAYQQSTAATRMIPVVMLQITGKASLFEPA